MGSKLDYLLSNLNNKCNYIILRGWEGLLEEEFENVTGDIDILCDDRQKVIEVLGAKRIHNSSHRDNYLVNCGETQIQFDIRYVGDDYYCKEWQKNMLQTRVFEKNFYVMDRCNYFYSLIYHILVHKRAFKYKYDNILFSLSENKQAFEYKPETLLIQLEKWMSDNQYKFVIPKDYAVDVNWNLLSNMNIAHFKWKKLMSFCYRKKDRILEFVKR